MTSNDLERLVTLRSRPGADGVPGPRAHPVSGPRRSALDAVGHLATERLDLCATGGLLVHDLETRALPRPTAPPSPRSLARLLVVAGVVGLVATGAGVVERVGLLDLVPACGAASVVCEPTAAPPPGLLALLVSLAGFAVVAAIGAVVTAGVTLPRRAGLGLLALVTAGLLAAHGLVAGDLVTLGAACWTCLAALVLAVPLFVYTVVHAHSQGWLRVARPTRLTTLVGHRRAVVAGWCGAVLVLGFLASDWYRANPAEDGALAAVGLICAATVLGAVVARRFSDRMGLWLSLASAMMMVTALTDIVPDVLHDAEEAGTPLWMPAVALVAGFVVVTWFTRGGCGHGASGSEEATGRHHVGEDDGGRSAAFGGVGAAAALTLHRVIEGATLALTPSVPVVGALLVHSASEGLALAALFGRTRRSMVPWLMISVAGPAVGVLVASVSPLPETAVPVLLALVGGVLLRTAMVGIGLVVEQRRRGELRTWHVAVAVVAAAALAAVTLGTH